MSIVQKKSHRLQGRARSPTEDPSSCSSASSDSSSSDSESSSGIEEQQQQADLPQQQISLHGEESSPSSSCSSGEDEQRSFASLLISDDQEADRERTSKSSGSTTRSEKTGGGKRRSSSSHGHRQHLAPGNNNSQGGGSATAMTREWPRFVFLRDYLDFTKRSQVLTPNSQLALLLYVLSQPADTCSPAGQDQSTCTLSVSLSTIVFILQMFHENECKLYHCRETSTLTDSNVQQLLESRQFYKDELLRELGRLTLTHPTSGAKQRHSHRRSGSLGQDTVARASLVQEAQDSDSDDDDEDAARSLAELLIPPASSKHHPHHATKTR